MNWVESEEKGRVKGNLLTSILGDTVEDESLRCSRRKDEFWEEDDEFKFRCPIGS